MNAKQIRNKNGSLDYFSYALIATACLGATWGLLAVLGGYFRQEFLMHLSHIPFWMMVGTVGVLLNYLPIAKSKPKVIPVIGIITTLVTVTWFCLDNFVEIEGWAGLLGRLKSSTLLLIACYCVTHLSLLMLTYREFHNNYLLVITSVVVALSGMAYWLVISGLVQDQLAVLVLVGAFCMFFIKIALTVALVVTYLKSP